MSSRATGRRILFGLLLVLFLPTFGACVTRSAFDTLETEHGALLAERDRLLGEVDRLTIERDSYEEQYIEAQESYEDERVVRSTLASNLERVAERAETLGSSLDDEKRAHLQAAARLAAREAEIAAMQSTYDELVGDLEAEVSSGEIEIERLREGLRLHVSDDVLFASGSAELDSQGRAVLAKVATQLQNLTDFIEVRGHTDDRRIRGALAARFPTNWELAAARAARVVRLLEERGVPGDRLAVVSLGPNQPIAPNDTRKSRARNRRIEIRLIPKERPAPPAKKAQAPPVSSAAPASETSKPPVPPTQPMRSGSNEAPSAEAAPETPAAPAPPAGASSPPLEMSAEG